MSPRVLSQAIFYVLLLTSTIIASAVLGVYVYNISSVYKIKIMNCEFINTIFTEPQ